MPSFQNNSYKEVTINLHPSFHEPEVTSMSEEKLAKHIIEMVLKQQCNVKTRLKLFGDKGEKAVIK